MFLILEMLLVFALAAEHFEKASQHEPDDFRVHERRTPLCLCDHFEKRRCK